MLPPEGPDRIHVACNDHRLVANAGLLLPVTMTHRLGVGELVDHHVDLGNGISLGDAQGKLLSLAAPALADGDCTNDADVPRIGGTAGTIDCAFKDPLVSIRQSPEVSRQVFYLDQRPGPPNPNLPFCPDRFPTGSQLLTAGRNPARQAATPPESHCPASRRTRP